MTAAIQTHYAGCYFRSRIEARWALFFDRLAIPWQYEPQGFNLPSGPYLPDFHLDIGEGIWWEVKGAEPTEQEMRALFDLTCETKKVAFIAWGSIPRDYTDDARISDAMGNRVRLRAGPRSIGWVPAALELSGIDNPRLLAAYTAARSARFEQAA